MHEKKPLLCRVEPLDAPLEECDPRCVLVEQDVLAGEVLADEVAQLAGIYPSGMFSSSGPRGRVRSRNLRMRMW